MSKELPYFKFNVSEWILGRISDLPDKVQGAFIIAICHYWHKKCDYFVNDFKSKIGKKRFELLQKHNLFEIKNDKIIIPFLNEQFSELSEIHPKRVKSGQAGGIASAKARSKAKSKHLDKEEEIDKELDKKKNIPELQVFLDYCKTIQEIDYPSLEFSIKSKYESWRDNGWKDGNDTPIKNWKGKIKNVIPHLKPMSAPVKTQSQQYSI